MKMVGGEEAYIFDKKKKKTSFILDSVKTRRVKEEMMCFHNIEFIFMSSFSLVLLVFFFLHSFSKKNVKMFFFLLYFISSSAGLAK